MLLKSIFVILIALVYLLSTGCSNKLIESGDASFVGKIAFTSNRDGSSEIYIMDANGTEQINITNNGGLVWNAYPSWSR